MVRTSQNESKSSASTTTIIATHNGKELVIGEPFDIDYFYSTLADLKAELEFKSGRQEDAQEFLSFLLNRLHEEMIKCLESLNPATQVTTSALNTSNSQQSNHLTNGNSKSNNNNNQNENNDEEDEDEWKEVGKKNKAFITRKTEFKQSPLSDIFCGQFRTALSQTGFKDKESVSLEPFFTIPLDIQVGFLFTYDFFF
jgi:ubiquitin carboxyl-terminal hydrolase 10